MRNARLKTSPRDGRRSPPRRARADARATGGTARARGARGAQRVRRSRPSGRLGRKLGWSSDRRAADDQPLPPPPAADLRRRRRPGARSCARCATPSSSGKVHHAYLFVGSRGTGKTSIAKILARSLNCVNGPTLEPVRRVRVVPRDRRLDLARRDRDGRRLEQLGRRHPRPAREGRLRPGDGRLEGLHPRRGAHALARGLERVPEDARGAAAEHDLRARHDRGAQGARRRSSTAATASTSSARRWSRSRRSSSGSPTRRASRPTTARSR